MREGGADRTFSSARPALTVWERSLLRMKRLSNATLRRTFRRTLVSVSPIRPFGDPVLRTPAEPVHDFDAELRRLVQDLTDTMMERPGGGLAAPPIGAG